MQSNYYFKATMQYLNLENITQLLGKYNMQTKSNIINVTCDPHQMEYTCYCQWVQSEANENATHYANEK